MIKTANIYSKNSKYIFKKHENDTYSSSICRIVYSKLNLIKHHFVEFFKVPKLLFESSNPIKSFYNPLTNLFINFEEKE